MDASPRTVAKIALPLIIAAGLGIAGAPASQVANDPFAPNQALAASAAKTTAAEPIEISVGSFSVTFPEGFEEASSKASSDATLGLYKKIDEENGYGTLAFIYASSDMEGTVSSAEVAEVLLAHTPALFQAANDDCKLITKIYETRTDSGDYLYFAMAADGEGNGGPVFIAADKKGNPLIMHVNGVADTDEASEDYFAQMAAIAKSVKGGVQIKGLADSQFDLDELTEAADPSQDGATSDVADALAAMLK